MDDMDDRSANLVSALVVGLADELDEATRRVTAQGATGASALATILAVPGEHIDELSRVLGITGSGTVRLVDRLAAEGLVERRPGRDRRSVSLWLTERGAEMATAIVAGRRAVLRRALETLTDEQARQLTGLVEQVLATLAVSRERADRICRLCDYVACPQDDCPVERSVS
ncbi:MarR family winged helix-turn-helix transcriptional regulator [Nonomuraea sp. NPDC050540]|uniref:MarR family winged helix-turn-helix transcriptional regulator n=1 Tax=Nonomuraea sp. NPDC050540 TaxID=3364367 RepID=UPI003792FA38